MDPNTVQFLKDIIARELPELVRLRQCVKLDRASLLDLQRQTQASEKVLAESIKKEVNSFRSLLDLMSLVEIDLSNFDRIGDDHAFQLIYDVLGYTPTADTRKLCNDVINDVVIEQRAHKLNKKAEIDE